MADPTVDAERGGAVQKLLNDRGVRAIVAQILVVGAVLLIGAWMINNAVQNLTERNIASGLGFLDREAGFGISETLIAYSPADTYSRAISVGIWNTLLVAGVGIVFCTIIGVIVGVARLSDNWLIRKLSGWYVELFRNTPVLLQLYFWYQLIGEALPAPRQAIDLSGMGFLSNRGLRMAAPVDHPAFPAMAVAVILALVGAWAWRRRADRLQAATGQRPPVIAPIAAMIILAPLAAFFAYGQPLVWDRPVLGGFNFRGGVNLSPELTALLLGLTLYTASFVAEIVRAGVAAVPRGQTEAARALGLSGAQTLRLVVLPQALRVIVPPVTSQYLNLTKNSSLAVAIGYPDLVSIVNTTINQTGQAIEGVTMLMLAYLTVSLAISGFMNWYNARIKLVER